MSPNERVILNGSSDSLSLALTVLNASIDGDSGAYTCMASNSLGEAQHTLNISVQEPTSKSTILELAGKPGCCIIIIIVPVPPFFVVSPESRVVAEGSGAGVELVCVVGGVPPPNMTWYFMDQLIPECSGGGGGIPPSMPCVMGDGEGGVVVVVVVVAEVSEDSVGRYSCRAINPGGEIGHEVTVHLMSNRSETAVIAQWNDPPRKGQPLL